MAIAFSSMSVQAAERDLQHGLKTEIYSGANFETKVLERIDPNIDHHWSTASPGPLVPVDFFSVRWSGWIKAPQPGRYTLVLTGDDGIRLSLDGQKIIDEWRGGLNTKSISVDLSGKAQKIQVEYCEHHGGAWVTLRWKKVGMASPQIIGSEFFFPDEKSATARGRTSINIRNGLNAEYFDLEGKKKLGMERVYRTESIWGDERPLPTVPHDAFARYSGFLVPPKTGRYKFLAFADDKAKVWIDGKMLLEVTLEDRSTGGRGEAFMELKEGTPYAIVIDYADTGWWGSYFLHWILPGEDVEYSIPCDCLYPTKQAVPRRRADAAGIPQNRKVNAPPANPGNIDPFNALGNGGAPVKKR